MRNFTRSPVVSGSGAEDIGIARRPDHTLSDATYAESARLEALHRAAEDNARNRRIDRDRIIRAALDSLESEASDRAILECSSLECSRSVDPVNYSYIAGCAEIPLGHGEPNRADYVAELLAEIRAELNPLVR